MTVGQSRAAYRCLAANWSEVAQKTVTRAMGWSHTSSLLVGRGIVVEPVTVDDAQRAANLWAPGSGLSLGDRLCLALGGRLDAIVLTADIAWGTSGRIEQIR